MLGVGGKHSGGQVKEVRETRDRQGKALCHVGRLEALEVGTVLRICRD